jgi:RNA-directed DNA polymerase
MGAERSRSEKGAARVTGEVSLARRVGDGIAESTREECQADPARGEYTQEGTLELMAEALRRENVVRAYRRVVANAGAAGVDGCTVEQLADLLRARWTPVKEALLSRTYIPQPVRKVEIDKPDGGKRMLGIPTVLDRLIQQCLLQVMQPIFDPTFSDASCGFRPRRSAPQAVERAREQVAAGYGWVVDLDLEKFFDRVNHDVLMARVARRIKDKRVLHLIRRYLQAGLMEGGLVSPRSEGTPQGGPLSPLLSNILLDELDQELERRGHRFVRYADDCNVYVKSEAAGERVMESLERFLQKRLRLKVNRNKSAVARPWQRKFLGYSMTRQRETKLRVAPESVKRLKAKLKPILRRGRGNNLAHTIAILAPKIRGWVAYFQRVEVTDEFEQLDVWVRQNIRRILWKQWKQPRTRERELRKRGLNAEQSRKSARNTRGPWWNAGALHMLQAVPVHTLKAQGLVSFLGEIQRLRTAS